MRPFVASAAAVAALIAAADLRGQQNEKRKRKNPAPFQWANPTNGTNALVRHGTFRSPSMRVDVGYCYYLPPGYHSTENRYPVVYHLHGGRPGNEWKSAGLAAFVDAAIRKGDIGPTIYVFPNGGPVSWYNVPDRNDAKGEDVLVRELIPHIDRTLRTIARREGRAIEGFSQGGRGTTRIMFKYPELFCAAAPGGSGYATEKRISENRGAESETLVFDPGDDAWTLAKAHAAKSKHGLPILVWVGTKGFNYDNNLDYMKYLRSLRIAHEKLIVPGAPHSARIVYEKRGRQLMQFHQNHFKRP